MDYSNLTREQFEKMLKADVSKEDIEMLWSIYSQSPQTSADIVDYSCECTMCGKPMAYRYCGMCTHCEMVWNS